MRPCCSNTSATTRWQSSTAPMLPWWIETRPVVAVRQRARRVVVAGVAGGDRRAAPEQVLADRPADAAGASRDECDLPLQPFHGAHLQSSWTSARVYSAPARLKPRGVDSAP